jgi:hypothetical protein
VLRIKLIMGAVLLLGVSVTVAAAQSSVPTVTVSVSGSNVVLDPSGPIGAGATRFTFDGQGDFNVATLRAGVSVDQLRRSLSNPRSVKSLGLVFIEAAVAAGRGPVTVDLRPNTTYVAVVIAGRRQAFTTFTTGGPTGARGPRPDARIRMVDYGFLGPKTLPRSGRIRVENAGTTLHFAIAASWRDRPPGRPSLPRHERAGPRACGRGGACRRPGADQPGLHQRQRGDLWPSWALRDGVLLQRAQPARHVPRLSSALSVRRAARRSRARFGSKDHLGLEGRGPGRDSTGVGQPQNATILRNLGFETIPRG